MKKQITSFIIEHKLLHKGATVLVGVSGGPDSLALLHVLISFRTKWNLHIIVLSVDHQLRGEQSAEELRHVQQLCKHWDVDVVTTKVNVEQYSQEQNLSKQVASRKLRYHFYEQEMNKFSADYLALGHHGDDQIETMLMSLTRSASSNALLGIPVKRKFATGEIIRPLLPVTKEDIYEYCEANNIETRFDPSNDDITDTRVYFRRKVIPLLKDKNPNLQTTIQHLSETIYEDELFLQTEAKSLIKQLVTYDTESRRASLVIIDFKQYPNPLQRRAFHLILNYLYSGSVPKDISYTHEKDFFTLIAEQTGTKTIHFPKNLHIERSYEVVSFYFAEENVDNEFLKTIPIPGELELPDGTVIIAEKVSTKDAEPNKHTYYCAEDAVKLPLAVRTRQPGDRIRWRGLQGRKRLSSLFIDEKIPRTKRDDWPLVVDQEQTVLWAIGLKKGKPNRTSHIPQWIKLQVKKQGDM